MPLMRERECVVKVMHVDATSRFDGNKAFQYDPRYLLEATFVFFLHQEDISNAIKDRKKLREAKVSVTQLWESLSKANNKVEKVEAKVKKAETKVAVAASKVITLQVKTHTLKVEVVES